MGMFQNLAKQIDEMEDDEDEGDDDMPDEEQMKEAQKMMQQLFGAMGNPNATEAGSNQSTGN